MGLFQNIARWAAESVGAIPSNPMDPRFWGGASSASVSGQHVTAESALQLDVVQSVLGRLGGTISTLPMMVFERGPDGEKKPAPDHPLYTLLHDDPNRFQIAQEYREEQVQHLGFWRNAYSIIHPGEDGSPIGELEQVHPERIQKIERKPDGRIYYTIYRLAPDIGTDTYRDDEIWHIRKAPLTKDGLRGKYMYETARDTFGKALAVESFGALYFKNGGSGGGVLEHPGTFKDKDQSEQFLEAWRMGGTGLNRHKDKLLLNGVKYNRFTVNNNEAQFIETIKQVSLKLCSLWNMPPHMAGLMDAASYASLEQQSTEFVVYCIAPFINAIEQSAEKYLLVGDDRKKFFVEMNVAGLLRGDFKTRMLGYASGRQWGWLSVNDIRRLENMPALAEGGDGYLVPMNMSPAGQPGQDGTNRQPGKPDPYDPADKPDDGEP